jgi:hypothetical protein
MPFTESQLNFMISIQSRDDWSPFYFFKLVAEGSFEGEQCEHKALVAILTQYTMDQLKNLQTALDILNQLPS